MKKIKFIVSFMIAISAGLVIEGSEDYNRFAKFKEWGKCILNESKNTGKELRAKIKIETNQFIAKAETETNQFIEESKKFQAKVETKKNQFIEESKKFQAKVETKTNQFIAKVETKTNQLIKEIKGLGAKGKTKKIPKKGGKSPSDPFKTETNQENFGKESSNLQENLFPLEENNEIKDESDDNKGSKNKSTYSRFLIIGILFFLVASVITTIGIDYFCSKKKVRPRNLRKRKKAPHSSSHSSNFKGLKPLLTFDEQTAQQIKIGESQENNASLKLDNFLHVLKKSFSQFQQFSPRKEVDDINLEEEIDIVFTSFSGDYLIMT